MDWDYLSFWTLVTLCLFTPLLHTRWWIDVFLIPAYLYAVIASFYQWYYPYPTAKLMVTTQGHQHFFIALCFLFVLLMKADVPSIKLKKCLGYLGLLNLIMTAILHFTHGTSWGLTSYYMGSPLIPNSAMNAAVNVALLPFMCDLGIQFELPAILAVGFMTSRSSSSTAWLSLFTMGMAFVWRTYIPKSLMFIPAGVVFLVSGKFFIGNFYEDGGRFESYRFFFSDFGVKEWLIGHGPASFMEWSAYLQFTKDFWARHEFSLWMHSDPLQLVWEMGALSAIPVLIMIYGFMKRADDATFLSLSAMLAMSVLYYPFHTPIPLTILFCLAKLVINGKPISERTL